MFLELLQASKVNFPSCTAAYHKSPQLTVATKNVVAVQGFYQGIFGLEPWPRSLNGIWLIHRLLVCFDYIKMNSMRAH